MNYTTQMYIMQAIFQNIHLISV